MTARERDRAKEKDPWRVYRAWFWCAAVYNAVWGTAVGFYPSLLLRAYGVTGQETVAGELPAIFAACIGMFVGVFAIGYACVAIDPMRFWPFAAIGLAGKALGPAGWAVEHFEGHLPWSSIWVNVTNDFVWWPAFILFLTKAARAELMMTNSRTRVPDGEQKATERVVNNNRGQR